MIRVVEIDEEAIREFTAAMHWYQESGPGLGYAFLRELHAALARIEKIPGVGAPFEGSVRRTLIKRFPYWPYYKVQGDVLRVIVCIDSRRDQSAVLDRIH